MIDRLLSFLCTPPVHGIDSHLLVRSWEHRLVLWVSLCFKMLIKFKLKALVSVVTAQYLLEYCTISSRILGQVSSKFHSVRVNYSWKVTWNNHADNFNLAKLLNKTCMVFIQDWPLLKAIWYIFLKFFIINV